MNNPTVSIRVAVGLRWLGLVGGLAGTISPVTFVVAAEIPAAGALGSAVRQQDSAGWRSLLAAKADVRERDAAGNTALHFAALNHDVAAARALIGAGAEVDATNAAGATALLYGAGNLELVKLLLERGANPNASSRTKRTPLMIAVAHLNAYDAVLALLEAGADVQAKDATDAAPVLLRAVAAGDPRTVDLLLARGAAKDASGASAAVLAAAGTGNTAMVERLLAAGVDPNLFMNGRGHALNESLFKGHQATALLLVEKGADINRRSPRGHATPPMIWAAYHESGDDALARALVARGADVNVTNDQGASALSYALRSGADTPLVKYLRSVGAKSPEPVAAKKLPERPVPQAAEARASLTRERLPATLALLVRSSNAFLDNGFVQQAKCTSCHGQDLPAVAYELARARGFTVDDASLGRQLAAQTGVWTERAETARQMTPPMGGAPVSIAYGLFGLRATGYEADEMTDAMVRYILRTQEPEGFWGDHTRRPPMEDGSFVATAWVALAVRDYAPAGYEREAADSQARSAAWLAQHLPTNHNEAAFQLLGLHWSGVPSARLGASIERLVRSQRTDGGWAQLPGLESDAWATGTALYALNQTGGLSTRDAVYQRGVAFLLRTQFEDGSWWVRSRAWPFQPHFNGQFPHGKDQWISQGATAWAAIALLLTLDPVKTLAPPPKARALIAAYRKSPVAARRKSAEIAAASAGAIDFAKDIQPLFERSCAGCHGGEKPRAGFSLASWDSILKGGASGEPALFPGDAEESLLFRYASGKIEDLEMPPLNRRDKYPAFSTPELELLRAWIEAGAAWSQGGSAPTGKVVLVP